ncbi:MAG: NAD(P)-binding protein [Betaproteobacteria bacterium]|nr:NAD(P)-binding protein [Betaproteobacteria bacterium]
MSTTPQTLQNSKLSYRRYKDGDTKFKRSQENIFQASWTYKCPTYIQSTPPCQGQCPAGEDIRGYLNIVRGIEKPPVGADGKPSMPWQEYAWRRLTDCNPFPAIMGRVCPAPCQTGCNRSKVEEYVGINSVEQFLGNYAIEKGLGFPKPEVETGKRIAIVGGGVAGMSAAYQLRKRGHACVVFESSNKLGGMLSFGLPAYRTPRDVVDAEIQRILDMGVEVRLNTRVGKDVGFADLKRNFDAIFIGIGAQVGNKLDIPGGDASNCTDGISFLRDYNEGKLAHAGKRIVVIGGGDTAMDCAAVARRLGAYEVDAESREHASVIVAARECDGGRGQKGAQHWRQSAEVVIAYRRHVQEMPASKHELEAVIQEGVEIQPCVAPVCVVKDENGMATALRVIRVDWVNKKMVPKEGSEYDIPADLIVSAVGQSVGWAGLEKFKNARNLANVDKNLQAVNEPGVFIGGDAITPLLLTTAIGHARIAAEGIDAYVSGKPLEKRPKVDKNLFDLPRDLAQRGVKFEPVTEPIRGTYTSRGALHNFDNRADRYTIPAESLFLGHFTYTPRNEREMVTIDAGNVLGSIDERLIALTEAQAQAEAKRCMSCGMCFECDNCVIYCPQTAVKRVPKKEASIGRYVMTDYFKCIGCHICMDVCPTGYIQMGLGGE